MDFTAEYAQILRETHDEVIKLSTVLLGVNGDKGLVGKVDDNCKRQDELEEKQSKLESNWKMLIGYMVGTGLITGGTFVGITKLLSG